MEAAEGLSQGWLKELSPQESIESLYRAAIALGLPLALWREAAKNSQYLLIDLSGQADRLRPELEALPPGFLFCPYEADLTAANEEKGMSLFLKAHLLLSITDAGTAFHMASNLSGKEAEQADRLLALAKEIHHRRPEGRAVKLPYYTQPGLSASGTDKEAYCRLVEKAVREIRQENLQKVVCARSKSLPVPEDFQPLSLFQRLCSAYSNAFVSFVCIPGSGSWMGASPETLIRVSSHKTFHTMSLAGTQPKSAAASPADAVWRQKEIEEQALVSRYIINCFKKIRLREFNEYGPRTVVAGNLMHLRTDFSVNMQEAEFPDLGSVMLSLLHPTSAVCGMPRTAAMEFLQQEEGLNRQFFAGFLGPVNLQEESSLFVNLRCMQLFEKQLMLYAGAGITADSIPEKEWKETEDKCATLASLLEN